MSLREWNEILELLESPRITTRNEGILRFRAFLSVTRHLKALNAERSHSWLKTLQSLFHLVITERNISVAKPTSTVEKRLEDATSLVKWTVERVSADLSRKAVKATIAHLTQMAGHGGRLQSYALTYLKTLRSVLQYGPHLEHLEPDMWTEIVSLCFSAVLGDKIKVGAEFMDDYAMEVDDSDDEERPRGSLRLTEEDDRQPTSKRRTATQTDIELLQCVETAFRSKSAPFLFYSTVIFRKFLRFFRHFPNETTAHLPALTALNRAFAELDLNDQATMSTTGASLWAPILALWGTKNASLKEQVVMSLKYLLPFVAPRSSNQPIALVVADKIQPLFDAVLSEPTIRWREGFELNIDNLRLGLEPQEDGARPQPFSAPTFRFGNDFEGKHAVAWNVLELGADSLAKLYAVSELGHQLGAVVSPPPTPEGSNTRNKRRKRVEEPLAAFIDSLRSSDALQTVPFRLQLVLFLIERHWSFLHLDMCQRIHRTIISLLTHDVLEIQAWAFVVVAAIAHLDVSSSDASLEGASSATRDRRAKVTPQWDQVWSIALRRMSNPAVCRAASHAASVLLATDRVDLAIVASSIENFAHDLDVQGPNFPSDAVCTFFESALVLTSSDVRLFRLRLPEKIFAWLSSTWKPLDGVVRFHNIGQTRPRADPLDPSRLASLVARLCGVENAPGLPYEFLIPDTPISSTAIDLCETVALRDFIDARIPSYRALAADRAKGGLDAVVTSGNGQAVPEGLDRRISVWLEKMLVDLTASGDESVDPEAYWASLNVDMARRHLDLAMMALVVDALFEVNKVRNSDPTTVKAACVLLRHLAGILGLGKWQPGERAALLNGLTPLLVPLPPYPPVAYPILLDPGPSSDLPLDLIPKASPSTTPKTDFDSAELVLLRTIWSHEPTLAVLEDVTKALHAILGVVVEGPPPPNPTPGTQQGSSTQHERDDDDFGEIKVAKALSMTNSTLPSSSERAGSACVATCVRGLISWAMASAKAKGPVRAQELVDAILKAEGDEGIVIAEHTFNAVHVGLLSFSLSMAESVLDHVGGTLLPAYRYARDERFTLAALRFLECTASMWITPESTDAEEFETNAQMLVAFYANALVKNKLYAWRVRLHFVAFLDTYLSFDFTQTRWDKGCDGPMTETTHERVLPSALLAQRLADDDFRVRFRAATSSAAFFAILFKNELDAMLHFNSIKSVLPTNLDCTEIFLTQIICNANIMIISGQLRRAPWPYLLSVVAQQPLYLPQVEATLDGVAERLGIDGRRALYTVYQRHYAALTQRKIVFGEESNDTPVPFRACGFRTLGEMRKADLRDTGTFLLANGNEDGFATLVNVVKLNDETCVLECLPDIIAESILRFDTNREGTGVASWDGLAAKIEQLAYRAGAGDAHLAEKLIKSVADEVITNFFASLYEKSWSVNDLQPAFSDKTLAATFRTLLSVPSNITSYEAATPYYGIDTVLPAVQWFLKTYGGYKTPAAVYSVTRRLLDQIQEVPFNELARQLLVSLSLALTLGARHAKNTTILGSVAESLVVLLARSELATIAASILRWCITEWLELLETDPSSSQYLCEIAVRAAFGCEFVLRRGWSDEVVSFVTEFTIFLKSVCLPKLLEIGEVTVTEAFLLWPWPIVDSAPLSIAQLEIALSSSFAPVSKFRLSTAIQKNQGLVGTPTSGEILWRLLEAMSPGSEPSLDECVAMADLTYEMAGTITTPGMEDRASRSSAEVVPTEPALKMVIVARLLDLLRSKNLKLVHLAFETIRTLFNVSTPSDLYSVEKLSPRSLGAAQLLAAPGLRRSHDKRMRTSRSLDELARDDWVSLGHNYAPWIVQFAELLADCRAAGEPFYAQLVPIVGRSTDVAATMLLHLVHSILIQEAKSAESDIRTLLSTYFTKLLEDPQISPRTLTTVVNLALELRNHPKPNLASVTLYDEWLVVPWVLLAEGAVKTGGYLAGLLFLELAHEYNDLFRLGEGGHPRDKKLDARSQTLLYDIYANIAEPDGFYGRESADVRVALAQRYQHEGRWGDALGHFGAQFENPSSRLGRPAPSEVSSGLVQSLASFGFNRLAMSILQPARAEGAINERDVPAGFPYELAWRTDTWDIPVERRAAGTSSVALYSALRAVHASRDHSGLVAMVDSVLVSETAKLAYVSLDSPAPDDTTVSTVLAIREIRNWATLDVGENLDPAIAARLPDISPSFTFEHAERILSTRISLLRSIRRAEQADRIGDLASDLYGQATGAEKACLLRLSSSARHAGHLQLSLNAVTLAHKLVEAHEDVHDVEEELANVLWAQGEHVPAITLLKTVKGATSGKQAILTARLGEWTSEAHMNNARETLYSYFLPAVDALAADATPSEQAGVHAAFATFADGQYEESAKILVEKESRANAFNQRKQVEFGELDRQLKALQGPKSQDDPKRKELDRLIQAGHFQIREDLRQVAESRETVAILLWTALEQYGKVLVASDDHDDVVFRFCSLWLATSGDNDLQTKLAPLLTAIKSRKFVFLAYQLSARLAKSTATTAFGKNVTRLVTRLAIEHPFHAFYPIQALRSPLPTLPPPVTSRSRRSSSSVTPAPAPTADSQSQSSRAQAAEDVVAKVKKRPELTKRIEDLELACSAYTEWASFDLLSADEYSVPKGGGRRARAGARLLIRKKMLILTRVVNLSIPVSTFDLPIDPACVYPDGSFPAIVKYDEWFVVAGGIHAPKIMVCKGSDGKDFKQLLKGEDDIRQDAVMEQAFVLINSLLTRDIKTRRRNLVIRTYRVVPLQNTTGLIEFVPNTKALGDTLIPLYHKYFNHVSLSDVRNKLIGIEGKKSTTPDWENLKVAAYLKILEKLPPVMRHVFFHKHKVPSLWFDLRLNYARSVATTSIVGHIVGLGDRHLNNILVDTVRGDLVPIDLGIAFDQGRRLPIPETVPFRLTQNIVDGFGMAGVDGVFRRCAEETLRVLRERSSVVMTVLEVFKHDPLQTWAVSVDLAQKVQGSSDENSEPIDVSSFSELPDDADRALAIVRSKLDRTLSVEYTVNQLIQEATDPRNLALIFSGWTSYM